MDTSKFPRVNGTPGLSLVDYFAARAMPFVVQKQTEVNNGNINPFNVGMMSYAIALGMLAAREQPEEAFIPKEPKIEPPSDLVKPDGPKLVIP
jgi:hypothetical protein